MEAETSAALDSHGESWREWVVENLIRGCSPRDMLRDMIQSTWSLEPAQRALDEALIILGKPTDWRVALPKLPETDRFEIDGQRINVLTRFASPRAALLDSVLTEAECAELIDYACARGLKPSVVIDDDSGANISHIERTSSSIFLSRAETPLIDRIERRLATMTGWPVSHGEALQVLRYEPGQQYKPHYDWFDAKKPGGASHLKKGGQRVGTTVIYLATAEVGGGTRFPKASVLMSPRAGGAVFFNDVTELGEPDEMSLHSGEPVDSGIKIVATYWQREGAFS